MERKSHGRRRHTEGLLDIETIVNSLEICPGQKILDAGCGYGYMSKRFSELVGNTGIVYALDANSEAIDTLKTEIDKTNIKPFVGDITTMPELKDSSIDIVYLSTVFHILSDDQVICFENEVRRILKPTGKLAVVEIIKEETPYGPPMEMRSSPEELRLKLSLTPGECIKVGEYFYMQLFVNNK